MGAPTATSAAAPAAAAAAAAPAAPAAAAGSTIALHDDYFDQCLAGISDQQADARLSREDGI